MITRICPPGLAVCLLALFATGGAVQGAPAGTTQKFTVDRYLDLQSASEPQVSPDGTLVVYTRTMIDKMTDRPQAAVWIVSSDGQHHRFVAKGSGAVWAPSGSRIAYLAEAANGVAQIFVQELNAGGPASQVTWGAQAPANLHWSPDGRAIGFSMVVPSPEKWTIELPAAPEGAKWANTPKFTERLHYRSDHVGLTERGFRHLFLVAADGGADDGRDDQADQDDDDGPEQDGWVLADRNYLMLVRQKVFINGVGNGIGSRHQPHNAT